MGGAVVGGVVVVVGSGGAVVGVVVVGSGGSSGEAVGGAVVDGAEFGGAELEGSEVVGAGGAVVEGVVSGMVSGGGCVAGGCVAGGTSGVSKGVGVLTEGAGVLTAGAMVVVASGNTVVSGGAVVVGFASEVSLPHAVRNIAAARATEASLMIFGRAKSLLGMITCRLVRHRGNTSHTAAFMAVFPFHQKAAGAICRREHDRGAFDAGAFCVLLQGGKLACLGRKRSGGGYCGPPGIFHKQALGLAQSCRSQRLARSHPVLGDEPCGLAAVHAFRVASRAHFRQHSSADGCQYFCFRDLVAGEVHALRDMAVRHAR